MLTAAQRAALGNLQSEGRLTGVTSAYHTPRAQMGNAAPTKRDVASYMRSQPSVQENRLPASHEGEKKRHCSRNPTSNSTKRVFCLYVFPPCFSQREGGTKRVHKAFILQIDGLTKLVYLKPASFGNEERPLSTTTRNGCIRFIEKARQLSQLPALQMAKIRTEGGSEWTAIFSRWISS